MSRLISLEAENFMICRSFFIEFNDRTLTKISGKNGQGKTTIASLEEMLRNVDKIPSKPITEGEDRGYIVGVYETDEGTITVKRVFTPSNSRGRLEVTTAEGAKFSSPQAVIDKLLSATSLGDPFEFCKLSDTKEGARKQINILLESLGKIDVDFSFVDVEYETGTLLETFDNAKKALMETRKPVSKRLHEIDVSLEAMGEVQDVKFINVLDVVLKRDEAQKHNMEVRRKKEILEEKEKLLYEKRLQHAKLLDELNELNKRISESAAEGNVLKSECKMMRDEVETLTEIDIEPYEETIRTVNDHNMEAMKFEERAKLIESRQELSTSEKKYTQQLRQLEELKNNILSQHELPLPGLGFDENGLTLYGIPVNQEGEAKQLEIAFAIAMHKKPKLPIFTVHRGGELDSDSWKTLEELAEKYNAQVLAVVVDETKKEGIVIEDGEIVVNNYE